LGYKGRSGLVAPRRTLARSVHGLPGRACPGRHRCRRGASRKPT